MKLQSIILIFTVYSILSFSTKNKENWIKIQWTGDFTDNFSFKDEWSYPEGIYKNKFDQLSCDGFCPPETEKMKDKDGRIYPDSLKNYYKLVDTTHLFHSLQSIAKTYEWAGTDFIEFKKQTDNSILGQSLCNASTHSSLNILIKNDSLTAWIDLNSINRLGKQRFPLQQGRIIIDKNLFEQGIIKAEFNFIFENTLNSMDEMYWKGLIYSKIN